MDIYSMSRLYLLLMMIESILIQGDRVTGRQVSGITKSGDMCGVRVLFTQIARTLNWQLYLKLETEILCANV